MSEKDKKIYKNSPSVRKYLAKRQKDYRARVKAKKLEKM